jgi:hypothetical protein
VLTNDVPNEIQIIQDENGLRRKTRTVCSIVLFPLELLVLVPLELDGVGLAEKGLRNGVVPDQEPVGQGLPHASLSPGS